MDKTQVPHNLEAEEALIGSALIDPGVITTVDVESTDFYVHRHRFIWDALLSLTNRKVSPDFVTLTEELDSSGKLAECGGRAKITEYITQPITSLHAKDYAQVIRDYAQRRRLIALAHDMAKVAYNTGVTLDQEISTFVERLALSGNVTDGAAHWKYMLAEVWDDIEQRVANPSDTWGIPTGFPTFDRTTGGLQAGESLVLSGKPGVGKSMLGVQMAEQMSDTAPGAIYSLEMTGRSVMRRVLSAQTKIRTRKLKSGDLDGGDWDSISKAVERLEKLPVYLSDGAGWTTTSLRADLSRLKVQHGIQWFMFDYMALAGDLRKEKEHERIGAISRGMKLICRHLDLAGIIIHSMTKEGINASIPSLTALRGEAGVAFDADVVCFLVDFQPAWDESVSKADQDNMRTLVFGKGRELENPRKFIHFVKAPYYPEFREHSKVEPEEYKSDWTDH